MQSSVLSVLLISMFCISGALAGACATFADAQWNCGDPDCSYRVPDGAGQPNYECAEFVARTIAAAGYVPGLDGHSAQAAFGSYGFKGRVYDLLWVSSREGGPIGLEDYLSAAGWHYCGTADDCVHECTALMVVGATGNYGHAVVGVGEQLCDAHNYARYHVPPSYYNPNAIWNPPGTVPKNSTRVRV